MKILAIDLDGKNRYIIILNKKKELLFFKKFQNKEISFPKTNYIVSGLSSKNILIKRKIIESKGRNLKKIISFQEETISFFDNKEAIVHSMVSKENKNKKEISFHITTKKDLKIHLNEMNKIDLDPDFVSSVSQAQTRFFKFHFPQKNEAFLVHIGSFYTTITLMENSLPKDSHFIKIGVEDLKKNNSEIFNKFLNESSKFIFSFLEKNKKIPIFFTGEISKVKDLKEIFLLKNSSFISKILEIEKKELLAFAISFGLALDFLSKDPLDFRKKEFRAKRQIKKLKIFNILFFISAIFLSSLIYFYCGKILKKRKENIYKNILLLKEIENIKDSKNLDFKNFKAKKELKIIEKKIDKEAESFSYFPLNRKVSFVLNWLHSHPLLNKAKIMFFDYKLVEYPSIQYPNKKYRVKIYMEFKMKEHTMAKKFHEKLLKDNLIDSKKEIKWNVEEDLYKISFFLTPLKVRDLYDIKKNKN